jgi:hypothetical protein
VVYNLYREAFWDFPNAFFNLAVFVIKDKIHQEQRRKVHHKGNEGPNRARTKKKSPS